MSNKNGSVGVIVARFHVPELHDGHRYTIDYVRERHEDVLIILGTAERLNDRNSLSFEMRKGMVESSYPDAKLSIVPSPSLPSSYEERSRRIDILIRSYFPDREAVMYGARDSFIHTYKGIFPKHEVPTVYTGSATEIRKAIQVINSADFRSGVIYAHMDRKPAGYPAVDVVIVNPSRDQVLLVGKEEEEGRLRFPGVFFTPSRDTSYEDAARRCLSKEVPGIIVGPLQIIASHQIDDGRFRKTREGIVTLLMKVEYQEGVPRRGKGIDAVQWVNFEDVRQVIIVGHKPLVDIMDGQWGIKTSSHR
jgi:bifunctional NMN adenylyltransferase/nudix hydrolase